jgi:hypothetical protein
MSPSDQPLRKRLKLESAVKATDKNDENQESALLPRAFKICQALLATTSACPTPSLPTSLTSVKTKNDLEKLRKLFDDHGFRTSVVMSPRPALSRACSVRPRKKAGQERLPQQQACEHRGTFVLSSRCVNNAPRGILAL